MYRTFLLYFFGAHCRVVILRLGFIMYSSPANYLLHYKSDQVLRLFNELR